MTFTVPESTVPTTDWKMIEEAIFDWVNDELDMPLIWENQNVAQPPYPYVSGQITAIDPEGSRKERRHQFNAAADAGKEIEVITTGTFTFTLTLNIHVDADAGANNPLENARMLGTRLQWSLHKRSTHNILSAAGVALVGELALLDTSVVVNGEWISRATLDVSLRAVAVVSETTTYIDKVTVNADISPGTKHDFTKTYDSTV